MQRYRAGSCTSAVNNSAIGAASARDTVRADSYSLPANFPLNSNKDIVMSTNEAPQKTTPPKLVILGKALKLAEQWVDNMSSLEDESTEVELEGRPSRLGLGAKISRQCKIGPSNDPVERKLHAKLDARKRKAAQSTEETTQSARDGIDDDDDDDEDEDLESRSKAFSKKRAVPLSSPFKARQKLK